MSKGSDNRNLYHEGVFVTVTAVVFVALTVLFCFFPRSSFSQLERRELAKFPSYTRDSLASGKYAEALGSWFSDTEPYRDEFMSFNHRFKKSLALKRGGEESVTFHAVSAQADPAQMAPAPPTEEELQNKERDIEAVGGIGADADAKMANRGIVIAGHGPETRALMVFGGSGKGKSAYAEAVNEYGRVLGSGVKVYAMVIPTSIEFYCPDKVKGKTNSQLATIKNIYSQLSDSVKAVDAYTPLGQHAAEPIYLRTDHHWAPLGAYYAARQFAQVAKVKVPDLKRYDRHVIHDFVGTMYGYSKDIAIKNAPEDFVYYTPKDTSYTTTYIVYDLDSKFRVVGEHAPTKGKFFYKFKDGSGMAYSTFMGSDRKTTVVRTGVGNGRKLMVIKDSFGNAFPGYMFESFEEVHVLDFRYFNRNLQQYVKEYGITDVVLFLNVFNAYSSSVARKFSHLLYQ